MQWSADEEARTKALEISQLKREVTNLSRLKDESLEKQRNELTIAFEQIITQRETFLQHQTDQLQHQLQQLSLKYEQIQTELLKSNNNNKDLKLKIEGKVEEILRLESQIQQITYEKDCIEQEKQQLDDRTQRQISQLERDLQRTQEVHSSMQTELTHQIDKVTIYKYIYYNLNYSI
jgi:chromosome segregation ATPase